MTEFFLGCVVGATIEAFVCVVGAKIEAFVALLAVWLHNNWE